MLTLIIILTRVCRQGINLGYDEKDTKNDSDDLNGFSVLHGSEICNKGKVVCHSFARMKGRTALAFIVNHEANF